MSEKKWPFEQNFASKHREWEWKGEEKKNAFEKKGMKIQFIFLWSRPFVSSFLLPFNFRNFHNERNFTNFFFLARCCFFMAMCICMPFFLLLFEYEEEKLIGNVRVGATVSLLSWLIGRVRNDANKKISAFLFFYKSTYNQIANVQKYILRLSNISIDTEFSVKKGKEKRQQKFISNKNRRMR